MMRVFLMSLFLMVGVMTIAAQDTLVIHPGAHFFVGSTDTLVISGNIKHEGIWGTTSGTTVLMRGSYWKNSTKSLFTGFDVNTGNINNLGGIFWFSNIARQQELDGGFNHVSYAGPQFPAIRLTNVRGLKLVNSDVSVRYSTRFDTGHIYLDQWDFIIGDTGIKSDIIGYSQNKFFVTRSELASAGSLIRRQLLVSVTDTIVFPVGTSVDSYTPAGIVNLGASADFSASVGDNVYELVTSGSRITDSVVNKTWRINTDKVNGSVSYNLVLQHNKAEETRGFQQVRLNSYMSMNAGSLWDFITPYGYGVSLFYDKSIILKDSSFYHWRNSGSFINPGKPYYFTKITSSRYNDPGKIGFRKFLKEVPRETSVGVYTVTFHFVVDNQNTRNKFSSVYISDNLRKVIASPTSFRILSARSLHNILTVNANYDGLSDTLLVINDSLLPGQSDTLELVLSIDIRQSNITSYINTSYIGYDAKLNSITWSNGRWLEAKSEVSFELPKKDVFIPQAFTPNGDGRNDKFIIVHQPEIRIELTVYNRWGIVVYENRDYKNDWAGISNKGQKLGSDSFDNTFFYKVVARNNNTQKVQILNGYVEIVR